MPNHPTRRRVAASLIAGAVSMAAVHLASAPGAAEPVRRPAPASLRDERSVGSKPFAPGTVTIDPASITATSPDIRVAVEPGPSLVDPTLTITSNGPVTVAGGSEAVADGRPSTATIDATTPSGPSTVTATLTGAPGPGGVVPAITDTVWLDEVGGTVVVSNTGTQDLQLQVIDLQEAKGLIDAEAAGSARRRALGGTDATISATTSATCATVCVSGTVRWTDSTGGTHPVRKAPVQVYEEEPGADQLLTTATTDDTGAYTATLADDDDGPGEGGRDVYVRVLAAGPGFAIKGKYIESATTGDIAPGTELTVGFVANQVADNNTAFSLQNAMVISGEYVALVHGSLFPHIDVVFPSTGGSYYDGTYLQVDGGDRWDWDVMLHEYGHYVADRLNIEDNPGGDHSSEDNLSVSRGSKAIGIPLAWGEGWPTFFAVSLQREMGVAELGVPNAGDTGYQDTEDQEIDQDLETGGTLGEDNEYTVMSILWDLFDETDDGLDHVSLGSTAIWNTLDALDPTSLSRAAGIFAPDATSSSLAVDCVFSQYNVSPRLSGAATATVATGAPSPKLVWTKGNGGTFRNDRFIVEYRAAGGALLFAAPAQASNSYQAPAGVWGAIRATSGGTVVATVVGTQTDTPRTGPYRSCPRTFSVDTARTPDVSWAIAASTDLLGREPAPGELVSMLRRRDAGVSKAAIARDLSRSDEWLGAIVTGLYENTLGRAPDPAGLAHWVNQLRTGHRTVAQVAAAFYSSNEYYSRAGGTPGAWIDDLYPALLGRAADPSGRSYWVAKVATSGRATVARQFYESLESRRSRVDGVYQALLHRAPDPAGRAYWADRIASDGDLALAVQLTASNEYSTRAVVRFP